MTPDSPSLTVKSQSYTDQTTTVWVSGGVAGDVHNILNHIITAAGREEDQTLQFKMKEQ